MLDILEQAADLIRQGRPAVMATVTRVTGSAPRNLGARMIILHDGTVTGSIGGGALEHRVMQEAPSVLESGQRTVLEFDLTADLNMGCGGKASVLLEPLQTDNPKLLILGAGHIGQALAPMASACGFRVWVLDGRPGFATEERFPAAAHRVPRLSPEHLHEDGRLETAMATTYVVVVTHSHELDTRLMEQLVRIESLAYLGMIGSRKKVATLKRHLSAQNVDDAALQRIRAPVGLPLGGSTPAEIALSILAEMQAVRWDSPLARRDPGDRSAE